MCLCFLDIRDYCIILILLLNMGICLTAKIMSYKAPCNSHAAMVSGLSIFFCFERQIREVCFWMISCHLVFACAHFLTTSYSRTTGAPCRKLVLQVEEAMDIQLNDAQRKIIAIQEASFLSCAQVTCDCARGFHCLLRILFKWIRLVTTG